MEQNVFDENQLKLLTSAFINRIFAIFGP